MSETEMKGRHLDDLLVRYRTQRMRVFCACALNDCTFRLSRDDTSPSLHRTEGIAAPASASHRELSASDPLSKLEDVASLPLLDLHLQLS